MAGTPAIPQEAQIDALLTGKLGNLVHRYCGGAWTALAASWTARIEQIVGEAKRRGLGTFVSTNPVGEGYWLSEAERGYVVFYFERGIHMHSERFDTLEPAFRYWLDQEMRISGLPVLDEP
jgi:hypothetical protein